MENRFDQDENHLDDETIKEIEKKIKEDEIIEIPESLKPENIETMLVGEEIKAKQKKSKKTWTNVYRWAAVAACFVLLVGGALGGTIVIRNMTGIGNTMKNQTTASAESSSEQTESASLSDEAAEPTIATAKSYDEIYGYIQQQEEQNNDTMRYEESDLSSAESSEKGLQTEAADYSDTNVRQEGVGEADIVKTDGNYIYTLKDGMSIQIVDVRNPEMSVAGVIDMSQQGYVSEIYLANERLYVFYAEDVSNTDANNYEYRTNTCVKTFDVGNPAEPKEIAKVSQSGDYYTMRVSGDYIYLFSRYYVYGVGDRDDIAQYIPFVQGKELAPERIYIPPTEVGSQYMIITTINMNQADEVYDSKAILSSSGQCYVSTESIYMCDYVYASDEDYNQTAIRKLNYKDGNLTAVGQTKIWGSLNDSFSIDEYQGYLRMVTTVTPITHHDVQPLLRRFESLKDFVEEDGEEEDEKTESNALYILDENLDLVSKLEGLAKDERIYSARFMGNIGYFVTYKQVDPLFSVDLSDAKNPKIIGELKIPGFSEYLHPYSDGLLLGIGMDVDETGTVTNGVKLSMFNTSDPANVSEINKQVLENMFSSNVFYDYKAVLIDAERNLIGFSANGDTQHYYVYSYDANSGFTCLLDRDIGNGWYGAARGIYVNNTLYIVEGYAIESYDLTTFDKIDDIVL